MPSPCSPEAARAKSQDHTEIPLDKSMRVIPRLGRIPRFQAVHDIRRAPSSVDEHGFRRAEPFVGMERTLFPDMG